MKNITEIKLGKITLECVVEVPEYRAATHDSPSEGGLDEMEVEYLIMRYNDKPIDILDLITELDCLELIREKIIEKLK